MDRTIWTSFLLLIISLLSADYACGSCDPMGPPCPPPFPDFMTLFAETLKNIPDLLVDNQISEPDCPESVNWTVFNWNLEAGTPVSLDPECSHSTPYPNAGNQTNPSGVPATSIGFPIPTNPSGSTVSTTPGLTPVYGGVGDSSGGKTNIGMAVGIAVGVGGAVLLALIVIIAVVCVRRHRAARRSKEDLIRRFQSITSSDGLVTAIEIGAPDTPQVQQTVVFLSDSTFQESSTDATLQRSTTSVDVNVAVIEKKFPDEMEAGGGCRNKAFEALEEDSEDPGYAGSEACQENWENEWNNKFEEALMESNEDLPSKVAEEGLDHKGETSSDSHQKKKNLSSLKKRPSPSLSASSSRRNSQVLDFRMPSPTRSAAFSAGNNSSLTKRPISSFSRPSATNWPTSGKIDTDLVVATASRSSFEKRSPSLTPTSDGPPAYSSPVIKPNEGPPFPRQMKPGDDSFDQPTPPATPQTPSGLPTYSEIMAVRDAPEPSSPHPSQTVSPQKQQRPLPPKKQLHSTKAPPLAAAAAASSSSSSSSSSSTSMSPSNPVESQSMESLVERNPNPWKAQAKLNGKTNNSAPVKPANTAVVRPWTSAGKGGQASSSSSDGRPPIAAPAAVLPPLAPLTPRTDGDSAAASVAPPSESAGSDYSSRPVRSLLSQFETMDRKNP